MEILKFTLSGSNACFRKPEMNSYCYFTYGNIHKVALLGMFGAILGYGGYTQMKGWEKEKGQAAFSLSFPEFYERLRELKVSVLPFRESKGLIPKKIQNFNNSVGYASREQGGNLIVKEQWLERPVWEICLLVDCGEAEKIRDAICNRTCVYYPYLGRNDHPADITAITVEEAKECSFELGRLACLSPRNMISIAELDYEEKEELEEQGEVDVWNSFKYQETLPYGMDGWTNNYLMQDFMYTNAFVEVKDTPVYQLKDGRKIVFY